MTYPRSHLVSQDGGVYHVHSRCVRRAYLCGDDKQSSRNFDHRKQWIEDRILSLADLFTVDLYGYAVMSNHYHVILNIAPERAAALTDEEVVERWMKLCPSKKTDERTLDLHRSNLLNDKARLTVIHERLGSLSWFMRFLNEALARLANREDGCTGRFWESRFKSQRLLDENAILGCMAYVDLNPVRAGIDDDPRDSQHTSLAKRLSTSETDQALVSLDSGKKLLPHALTTASYLEIVLWTQHAKEQRLPSNPTALPSLDLWHQFFVPRPGCWQRALGSVQSLNDYAQAIGQRWIRKATNAHRIYAID